MANISQAGQSSPPVTAAHPMRTGRSARRQRPQTVFCHVVRLSQSV